MTAMTTEATELEQLRFANRVLGVEAWTLELSESELERARLAIHPEDLPHVDARIQACLAGSAAEFEAVYRLREDDGSMCRKLGRGVVIRDDAGRPIRIAGSRVDITGLGLGPHATGPAVEITQAEQTQEELRRVRDRLAFAVTGSQAASWAVEIPDGDMARARVVFNNFWELLGYEVPPPGAELLGAMLDQAVAPEDLPPVAWCMLPTSARGAEEALAALARAHSAGTPFSLVLLNARMRDSDGAALAREMRWRWDNGAPRVILLSPDDSTPLPALARAHGVLACLSKPIEQSELLEAIGAVMHLDLAVPSSSSRTEHARPLRVLVAEDNEFNVTLLRALLSQRGYVAEFVHDGRAALDRALQVQFDLMLLDLHMPELDGFAVVEAIRAHERGTAQHLRIIALTARTSARDRERCLAAGMDEFLAKPIAAAALWTTMDSLVAAWPLTAVTPRSAELGVFDTRTLMHASGGQADILEKLRVVLRRTVTAQMSRVRSGLASGDLTAVGEAAHQLLGTVASLSTVMGDVAAALEDAAIGEDRESCAALAIRLDSLCAALLDATETLAVESLSL